MKSQGMQELKLEEGLDRQNPPLTHPHSLFVGRINSSHGAAQLGFGQDHKTQELSLLQHRPGDSLGTNNDFSPCWDSIQECTGMNQPPGPLLAKHPWWEQGERGLCLGAAPGSGM